VRPTPLAPQPRRRALADLDAQIACAEAIRSRYVQDLEAFPGARRRTQVLLRIAIAEERVDRLRRSREVLLAGDEGR
jgi:hypothetical protein